MKQNMLFILLLLVVQMTDAQPNRMNQKDKNGLKVGTWKFGTSPGAPYEQGAFVVIPIDHSLDYSSDRRERVFVHQVINELRFEYAGKTDEMISVKDGEWITYVKNEAGKYQVDHMEYFDKGYLYKRRQYPPLPNDYAAYYNAYNKLFTDYTEVFVKTDSFIRTDTYVKDDTVVIQSTGATSYYPFRKLHFESLVAKLDARYFIPDTVYHRFSARQKMQINRISGPSYLAFCHPTKNAPLQFDLEANQQDSIGIIYTAAQNDFELKDTIKLHGSGGG